MIDHAGYFIQMGMASIPIWMEGVLNRKCPEWKNVKRFEDGSANAVPAGLRVLERVMMREFGRDNVVVCYPDDVDQFTGPPNYWKFLREDNGDIPTSGTTASVQPRVRDDAISVAG